MDANTHPVQLPAAVALYFDAHDRHDVDAALAQFASDATVRDERRAHAGHHEIRGWLANAGRQYTYTRTFLGAQQQTDATWIVRNRLDGNFPGGTADLAYRFTFHDDGRISELLIAP
jgi:hypothetical protein